MLSTSSAQVASLLDWMAEQQNAESIRIGRLIKQLREGKGWSQQTLAHEINMGVSTVSRWERGLHKGYAANARKLAEKLEVDVALLRPIEPEFQTQLDRIESGVVEIKALLSGDGSAWREAFEDLIAQLRDTASSPRSQGNDPPKSRPGAARRKPA